MARLTPIQTSFNAGELSPLVEGRTDLQRYRSGCRRLENMLPLVQGPATRRPGTRFVAEIKDSASKARLVPFEFSTEQAYVIELGDGYARFYRDGGQIQSAGNPYEIATPWSEEELDALGIVQSADVLIVCHPDHAPRQISRTGHTAWSLSVFESEDGPYLPINGDTSLTLTPSGLSGTITLTASAPLFQFTDVGRHLRLETYKTVGETEPTRWSWGIVQAVTSATSATLQLKRVLLDAVETSEWRLGLWGQEKGWPGTVTFFGDRLFFGGVRGFPQRIDGSVVGDYPRFRPSGEDGSVAADDALALSLNAEQVNAVRWMSSDERGLILGTVGAEWILRPSILGEALTPANAEARITTTHGSALVQPVRAGGAHLFVQRAGRKLRELGYRFESEGFTAPDLTTLVPEITAGGLAALAFQQEPLSSVWAATRDGQLISLTYQPEQKALAWSRHPLGGEGAVESLVVVPATEGGSDRLWLLVRRTLGGQTRRLVEVMTPLREGGEALDQAFFVDSGLSYEGEPTASLSGLDHLEGETVVILADGAAHPDRTVIGGAISLERPASVVHAGLGYVSTLETLPLDAGSPDQSIQGARKRITRVGFRLFESLGGKVGPDEGHLELLPARVTGDPLDRPPPLFSGDREVAWPKGYETEGRIRVVQDQPLPLTLLAIVPRVVTVAS